MNVQISKEYLLKTEKGEMTMAKYKILMHYPEGDDLEDDVFETEEAAQDYGNYLISCGRQGAEDFYMMNPGDYPLEEYEDPEFEVIEVDE